MRACRVQGDVLRERLPSFSFRLPDFAAKVSGDNRSEFKNCRVVRESGVRSQESGVGSRESGVRDM
ncbi:hypothetical protein V0288_02390 [Pannus brasiliensis CCIBt3594]|uniref:Uncharacterized protein n=1 Tax=Pannus brasiliensis CCIBt3594 TaxID=1427578 RepID=A0AAW9QMJ7_9CHRO